MLFTYFIGLLKRARNTNIQRININPGNNFKWKWCGCDSDMEMVLKQHGNSNGQIDVEVDRGMNVTELIKNYENKYSREIIY